jgi:hypothetical protein
VPQPKKIPFSSQDLRNERPVLIEKREYKTSTSKFHEGLRLHYNTVRHDEKYKLKIALVDENIEGSVSIKKEFTFLSSLGKDNYFYIFDPIAIGKNKYLMKFGRADTTTGSYKLVTYQEGDRESRILINGDLRNKYVKVSPDNMYVAYIVGGSYEGVEREYFDQPLELWVCNISTGEKKRIARGDALDQSYEWKDKNTLVFFNTIPLPKDKKLPDEKYVEFESIISTYDALSQVTKIEWRGHNVPWRNDKLGKTLQIASYLDDIQTKDNSLTVWGEKTKDPTLQNLQADSYKVENGHISFYASVGKPKKIIEAKSSGDEFALLYKGWEYSSKNNTFLSQDFPAVRVTTYRYQPSLKRIISTPDRVVVAIKRFDKGRSPVTQSPEVAFPQKIFSLNQISREGKNQVLWEQEGVFGLSVMAPNGSRTTLNY